MRQTSDFDNVLWGLVNFKHHTLGFLKDRGYLISSSVDWQDTGSETGRVFCRVGYNSLFSILQVFGLTFKY